MSFFDLHKQGCFVLPNAWDAGSARMLEAAGFPAIATTSAGIAFSMGYPDHGPSGGRRGPLGDEWRVLPAIGGKMLHSQG